MQAMSREVTIMIKDELLTCVWGETWKEWNYDYRPKVKYENHSQAYNV